MLFGVVGVEAERSKLDDLEVSKAQGLELTRDDAF